MRALVSEIWSRAASYRTFLIYLMEIKDCNMLIALEYATDKYLSMYGKKATWYDEIRKLHRQCVEELLKNKPLC